MLILKDSLKVIWKILGQGFIPLPAEARLVGRLEPGLWVPGMRFLIGIVQMSLGTQTPSDFLKQITGRPAVIKWNSGPDYRGVLACLDSYMNIALERTEECVNGCIYLRRQCVTHKHTEEKVMKTSKVQYFSYLDIYFMRFFGFFWYNLSYFIRAGDFSLTCE